VGTLQKRKLGNSGLEIAPLVLGGNVFGWTVEEPLAFQIFDAFTAAGFHMIDTANSYPSWVPGNSGGESESIIGNWLARSGKRASVLIATKVGWEISSERKGLKRDYILKSAEESLKRLRTDYIDLYQSHKDDPTTPLEETLEAHAQLIRQGKVRAIGASNYSAARLTDALRVSEQHGLPRYESLQPLYNLYDRADFEKDLEPVCRENNLGVIPYFSLAAGFLTGKYRSEKDTQQGARGGRVKKYLNERGMRILSALDGVSKTLDSKPARVALAWILARPSITAPIASATSLDQLNDLIAATQLNLDAESLKLLNDASAWEDETKATVAAS
jgi:aryl-alcohol dehydrogenase-like predicted oxidoreductase